MRYLLTTIFIALFFSSYSQISYNRADYGHIGDKVLYAIDTPVSMAASSIVLMSGSYKTWNFSSIILANKYDSLLFNTPSVGAPPDANLMISSSNSNRFEYIDSNFMKFILDRPNNNITGLTLKIYSFPISYGAIQIDSINYLKIGTPADFNAPILGTIGYDSVKAVIRAIDTTRCLGWGQIILPDTTCSVLQLKISSVSDINLFGHSPLSGWVNINSIPAIVPHQKNVEYQWLNKNGKNYIARASMDTDGLAVQSITYRVSKIKLPSIKSVSPSFGERGNTFDIIITGNNTHFKNGTNIAAYVNLGVSNLVVNSVYVTNDTLMTANITISQNNQLGLYDVSVNDSVSGILASSKVFQVIASSNLPQLKSITPSYSEKGKTITVSVSGSFTHFKQSPSLTTVGFYFNSNLSSNIKINSINALNDSMLNCSITIDTAAALGLYSINISDLSDGTLIYNNAFNVVVVIQGINDKEGNAGFLKIYPNPFNNIIFIEQNTQYLKSTQIKIFSANGELVQQSFIDVDSSQIDVTNLPKGLYIIRLNEDEEYVRFIKE